MKKKSTINNQNGKGSMTVSAYDTLGYYNVKMFHLQLC